jgi:hypothetical protein
MIRTHSPRSLTTVLVLAVILGLAGCRTPHRTGAGGQMRDDDSSLPFLRSERLNGFRIAEQYEGPASTQYVLTNAGRVLKLDLLPDVDADSAQVLLDDSIMGLRALYANALSPYPGDLSNQVVAAERFKPQFIRRQMPGVIYSYFLLFANERLGYGAMSTDSVKFRSLIGWFYCAEGRTFCKIRYFVPLATPSKELEADFLSLACP